jgi:hypothetical protein
MMTNSTQDQQTRDVVDISVFTLESMIDSLSAALNVCDGVDYQSDDHEKTAPYALGYSRAALRLVVEQLKTCASA